MSELDMIVGQLTKKFGQGSAFRMTELPESGVTGWTSTGSPPIDEIIGRPGIPDGRVTTIIGPSSTGKTTLVTEIMTQHQKRGGIPFYWNTECSYEPERAKEIGLDLEKVVISQPGTCEEAFGMAALIAENASGTVPLLICWDTFSATPTFSEVYGTGEAAKRRAKAGEMEAEVSMGGRSLGEHARLVSQQMRKLQGPMEQKNVTFLVVLQSKEKIGIQWGSGVTYLAEKPWFFYSNLQLECKRVGMVKAGEEIIGIRTQIYCRKSKVGPPFRKCEVDCMFVGGFSNDTSLLEKAVKIGFVQPSGAGWFFYTASDGSEVKFCLGGKKRLTWRKLLEQVPQIKEMLEKAE